MIDIKSLQALVQAELSPLGIEGCRLKLIDLLLSSPVESPIFNHNYLLQQMQGYSIEQIQSSINYLKSSPLKLFSQKYFYVDDEGVNHEISNEELHAAFLDNALLHPDNSRPDPEFRSKVFIAYVGNKSEIVP